MNIKFLYSLFALIMLTTSCNKSGKEIDGSGDEGFLKLSVGVDFEVTDKTKSDDSADSEPWLNVDNYSISINKEAAPYAGWDKVSEMPKEVKLQPHDYSILAWWGNNVAADFDSPFYFGEQQFTINSNETTTVDIETSLMNAMVDVNFTEEFLYKFKDYYYIAVELHNEFTADAPLRITPDETRTAYVNPSKLYLRLYLLKVDGTSLYYGLTTIDEVLAKDKITVTLNTDVDDTTGEFNVVVNDDTNRIDQSHSIDQSDLIIPEPEIKLSFVSPFSCTEQLPVDNNKKMVYIKSEGGLKNLKLTHTSPALTAAGVPSELSLLDDSAIATLESAGIKCDIKDARSIIDFTDFTAKTLISDGSQDSENNNFTLSVTDNCDNVKSKDLGITINRIQFTVPEVPKGLIWTKEATAYAPTSTQVSQDKLLEKITCAVSSDDGATWQDVSINSQNRYPISGLTANTNYKLRYTYDNRFNEFVDFKTLPILSVANNSFESYSSARTSNSKDRAPIYNYTFTSWGTNNATTLSPNKKHNYNNWPSTESVTDKTAGDRAIVVQAVAYGTNTCVKTGYIIDKVASGMMFLGSSEAAGTAFASKPTALLFDYKFHKVNNRSFYIHIAIENRTNGVTTTLGEGTLIDGVEKSSYLKNKTIAINYKSGNEELAPTHMIINIRSNKDTDLGHDDVEHHWGSIGTITWPLDEAFLDTQYIGNQLWVDNLRLQFNK